MDWALRFLGVGNASAVELGSPMSVIERDGRPWLTIDCGGEGLTAYVAHYGGYPESLFITHAHLDHVTGVARAKQALGVPVWLHRDDNFLYERVVQQGQMFGLPVDPQPPIDHFYHGEGPLRFGRYEVRVLHTPGHCPGGVCLAISKDTKEAKDTKDTKELPTLIVGDTLFAGSIGRTDLPGGDMETLLRSIREVLFSFPDDCVVWSGHGEPTTIGREKRTNPFLI